ncbi:MAG TPA: type 4a pilus biogenesis protein PilO [Desulfotomaculum sp.]|nr:type 4a pilus biogenesis protein PilO [Desulfotomaculum sp.]
MWARLSRREQVLLVLLLVVLTGFFGYKYIFIPQYRHFSERAAQLDQARQQLQQAQKTAALLNVETRQLQDARERYNAIAERFAAEMRDGGAIVNLGLRAAACGVQITRWQAMDVVEQPYYLELPVNMEMRGSYQGVLAFIDELENRKAVPNLVSIRKLTLEAPEKKQAGSGQPGTQGQASPAAVTGPQEVQGKLLLVFYSQPTPAGRLALEQVAGWKVGRADPYQQADLVSPYQGVAPLGLPPGVPTGSGAGTGPVGVPPGTGTGAENTPPGWLPWPGFPGIPPWLTAPAPGAPAGGTVPVPAPGQSPDQGSPAGAAGQKGGQPAAAGGPAGQAGGQGVPGAPAGGQGTSPGTASSGKE